MSSRSSSPDLELRLTLESDWGCAVSDPSRPPAVEAHLLAPPEVWDVCWCHVPDRKDIRSLSLTCRMFREIAQPLFFERVALTGLPRGKFPSRLERTGLLRLQERLAALAKSPLRLCVRHLTLTRWFSASTVSYIREPTQAIFRAVASFANLRTAMCNEVYMLSAHFQDLCSHPTFRKLGLRQCQWPVDDAFPFRLTYVEVAGSYDFSLALVMSCLAIIKPDRLLDLKLLSSALVQPLLSDLAALPPFLLLTSLEIQIPGHMDSQTITRFLKRCPSLTRLEMYYPYNTRPSLDVSTLSPRDLPLLTCYAGPAQTISIVVHGRPVTHLIFRNHVVWMNHHLPHPLEFSLQSDFEAIPQQACAQINVLTVRQGQFGETPAKLLRTYRHYFPNLCHVHLMSISWARLIASR